MLGEFLCLGKGTKPLAPVLACANRRVRRRLCHLGSKIKINGNGNGNGNGNELKPNAR
ncbi:hypothetical protein [Pseudomonas sp. StFLB209]|uniref:hypothetical protein n=1 Tax=Pseudomonas sp. StFLB209 TaxID=1028989 RepID=UPI000AED19B8|nr:hypothetical protein [Pseudomonas sp. StFLB209]